MRSEESIREKIEEIAENIMNGDYCDICFIGCNKDTQCYNIQIDIHKKLCEVLEGEDE